MKKTFRKILAAVLAIVMLTGGLSAFAAEEKESIIYSTGKVLEYAGKLTEGENRITLPNADYSYVEFTAEKDGYYTFMSVNDEWYSSNWLRSLEKQSDGTYYNDDSYMFYIYKPEGMTLFLKLEAGEVLFRIRTNDNSEAMKVTAEYLGAEITDVDFSMGIDYPMIQGYDFSPDRYEAPGYSYYFYADDFSFTFDSGKSVRMEDSGSMGLYFSSETEVTEGEYAVNVHFADRSFEKNIRVSSPETYITKIEAVDPEKFYGIEYYNGDQFYLGCDVTYNVTFSNGETIQTGSEEYFKVPGMNREMYISRNYNETKNGVTVELMIGYSKFAEYSCEIRKADISENFSHMAEECSYIISNFSWYVEMYYERIEMADSNADKLRAVGVWVSYFNNNIPYILAELVSEFTACLASSFITY
ncbi:MAG: hypothetical protein IJD78_05770 [Clostridia bacterium]|nr:hypothetical protein [Clostridia bacterium]